MPTLVDGAREFGIHLTPEQVNAFDVYYHELIAWNTRMNLTAIIEHDQVVIKHFLDSLSVVPILRDVIAGSLLTGATVLSDPELDEGESKPATNQFPSSTEIASSRAPSTPRRSAQDAFLAMTRGMRLIDIGTGAGFPGIPLKIAIPNLRLTLLETTGKKVEFLSHVISELHLSNAIAIQARAEDLGHDANHREQYEVAVARAVANMATLSEYALPFVRKGGMFIAQKGVDIADELKQAEPALEILGGRVREIVPVQLPGLEPRHIIVIDKIAEMPDAYPRRPGTPERKPIR